jgi:hypothetical protein
MQPSPHTSEAGIKGLQACTERSQPQQTAGNRRVPEALTAPSVVKFWRCIARRPCLCQCRFPFAGPSPPKVADLERGRRIRVWAKAPDAREKDVHALEVPVHDVLVVEVVQTQGKVEAPLQGLFRVDGLLLCAQFLPNFGPCVRHGARCATTFLDVE